MEGLSGRAALCSQPITPAAPWPGQKALLLHHAQALFHKHHHRWSLLQPVPRPQGPEERSWQWTAQGSSSSCKLTTHIWNSGQMPGPLDGEAGILTFRTKCEELHSRGAFLGGESSPAHTAERSLAGTPPWTSPVCWDLYGTLTIPHIAVGMAGYDVPIPHSERCISSSHRGLETSLC